MPTSSFNRILSGFWFPKHKGVYLLVCRAFSAEFAGELGFDQFDEFNDAGVVVVENFVAGIHCIAVGGVGCFANADKNSFAIRNFDNVILINLLFSVLAIKPFDKFSDAFFDFGCRIVIE